MIFSLGCCCSTFCSNSDLTLNYIVLVMTTKIDNQCKVENEEGCGPIVGCSFSDLLSKCQLKSELWVAGFFPAFGLAEFTLLLIFDMSNLSIQDMTRDFRGILMLVFFGLAHLMFFIALIVTIATNAGALVNMPIAFTGVTFAVMFLHLVVAAATFVV